MTATTRWDAADHIDDDREAAAYLAAALEDGEIEDVRNALGAIVRARGVSAVAKKAALSRQTVHVAGGQTGNPTLETVLAVVKALGFKLTVLDEEGEADQRAA